MVLISYLITVASFALALSLKVYEPKRRIEKRIQAFVNADRSFEEKKEKEKESVLKKVWYYLRRLSTHSFGNKFFSKREENVERKLQQAGNPLGMTALDFQVLRIVVSILLPALFGAYAKLLNLGSLGIIGVMLMGFLLALIFPGYYLGQKTRQRHRNGLRELPDFLDLLTVCLEAGLGFDGALNKVISKQNGVLSSEFHICIEEIRLGRTRKEALIGVKERLNFDEMQSLINSILQAEKLGISIVQILRIKSQEERERRKQRAEEAAMKAPIKILFPLVLFIFPSIFAVLLGPAIIQFITTMSSQH